MGMLGIEEDGRSQSVRTACGRKDIIDAIGSIRVILQESRVTVEKRHQGLRVSNTRSE